MDGTGSLLGDFGSGDNAPTEGALPTQATLKREQDSTDDFEHLDREPKRDEPGESPLHQRGAAQTATQSFLDMERDELTNPPRAPSVTDKLMDHFADKFTDSESEPGDSPLHRLQPAAVPEADPSAPTANPDPSPVLSPTPAPTPTPPPPAKPAPEVPKVDRDPTPEPAAAPVPAPAPGPAAAVSEPEPPSKPAPAPAAPPAGPRTPAAHVIEAEVIFRQMGLDAWFDPKRLHPKVESVIYWRQPAQSGAALGGGLALLVALACCSVVSVAAYGSLAALCAAVAYRLYRNVLQAVQKTDDGHPFKWWLERELSIPAERAQAAAAAGTAHLNAALHELRRLFLVEDLVDSLKFGVLLWCLTHVGAYFNGITLIILGWVALFTLPKAYEMNKAQVDANLELARQKINEITAKVRAAVPLGRKSESDKDK